MQGRTVGSPRTITGNQRHFGARHADVIAAQPMLGRAHGSRPALFRSLLTVSLIAGGLSAALIGSGVDLGKVGLSTAVSTAQAATELPMPRPRIHTVALATDTDLEQTPLRASASFAAVHDSTPISAPTRWTGSRTTSCCRRVRPATPTTSSNSAR
jgi:hypothetical protein